MNKDLRKAYKIIDIAIRKAKKERDTKGYRENLGYDSWYKIEEKIGSLNLSYQEECKVKDYFYSECDNI